ncbi:MAG: redoxin domain-containing protein, partial [Anaerolineae bacterium]|nr:redoxin domain-containing protein [Anaerolineae bacterium]
MQQIVDLENDPPWQALDVAILNIALDSADQQAAVKQEYGINAPMLVDADRQVSDLFTTGHFYQTSRIGTWKATGIGKSSFKKW